MNGAHLHLMINHLPVIGIPLVTLVVAWGVWRKSTEVLRLGLGLAVVVAVATYPVFLTGEPAEEFVEEMSWANHDLVERHEERAEAAIILTLLAGAIAGVAMWRLRGGRQLPPAMSAAVIGALLISGSSIAWTALAGGDIRHDEIRADAQSSVTASADDDDGSDEEPEGRDHER